MKARLLLISLLLVFAISPLAAQERSYTEGAVSIVTSVKIMDGQYENYINYLSSTYKPVLEAQKKAGIIIGYNFYDANPRSPDDADLYLVVSYANMAAFDGLSDRTEPVMKSVTGLSRAEATAAGVERGKMREILGNEMIRELKVK